MAMRSSWKALTSATRKSKPADLATALQIGSSRPPAERALAPAYRRQCDSISAVVVLPFVPATAKTGQEQCRKPYSSSPPTGQGSREASSPSRLFGAMTGLTTATSVGSDHVSPCHSSNTLAFLARRRPARSSRSGPPPESRTVTVAPCWDANSAAAPPPRVQAENQHSPAGTGPGLHGRGDRQCGAAL